MSSSFLYFFRVPNAESETLQGSRHSACLRCKQRKKVCTIYTARKFCTYARPKKCDGLKPACSICIRMGRASECVYRASSPPPKRFHPPSKNGDKAMVLLNIGPGIEVLVFDKSGNWWKLDKLPVGLTDFLYVNIDALPIKAHPR
jgi:hypothetical protein